MGFYSVAMVYNKAQHTQIHIYKITQNDQTKHSTQSYMNN
jgi:hypothetical protein